MTLPDLFHQILAMFYKYYHQILQLQMVLDPKNRKITCKHCLHTILKLLVICESFHNE